jgi:hypothetical protein
MSGVILRKFLIALLFQLLPAILYTQSHCINEFQMSLRGTIDRLSFIGGFADVNYNGKLDVVAMSDTMAGPFHVYYLSVFEKDSGFTYTEIYKGDDQYIPNWVGDSDRDGLMEVFIRDRFEPNQIFLWESIDSSRMPLPPIDFWHQDSLGRVIWTYWGVGAGSSLPYPQVVDVDGDSVPEFLFFNLDTLSDERFLDIVEIPGNNMFQVRQRLLLGMYEGGAISVADFDNDGKIEMVFGSATGDLFVYEAADPDSFAFVRILQATDGDVYEGTRLRDSNGNGKDEFVYGGAIPEYGYQVYVMYEATGDNQYGEIFRDIVYNFPFSPEILKAGDLDGDGIDDLVVYTQDSTRVYQYSVEAGFHCTWGSEIGSIFFRLSDTDSNQLSEIWYGSGPTYALEYSGPTGVAEGNSMEPVRFALFQNYPNPFNGETNIRFNLSASSHVRIVIYDCLGREVKTIRNQFMKAGDNGVVWACDDDQRRQVTSGVYIYRVTVDGFSRIGKMILIR